MAPLVQIPISIYLISLLFFSSTNLALSKSDIHDLMATYGLPRGLIPDNVKSYSISDSGSFVVELNTPCYVHFELLVYYDTVIRGKLGDGSVHDVSGIQAKKAFLWLPVTGIEVIKSDDTVQFFVGPLSKTLPASQFDEIPACGSKASSPNLDSI